MELLDVTNFDTIVLGTGVEESLLACSLAQNNQSILHLDGRGHYGGLWASFQLHQLVQFLKEQELKGQDPVTNPFSHITFEYPALSLSSIISRLKQKLNDQGSQNFGDGFKLEQVDASSFPFQQFQQMLLANVQSDYLTPEFKPLLETTVRYLYEATLIPYLQLSTLEREFELDQIIQMGLSELERLLAYSRHYCIELTIKKLLANGAFTRVVINSGIHNYLEFKLVNQTQVCWADTLRKVPLTKEDVFVDQQLSLIDKRKLMKFLTFVNHYTEQPEVWEAKKHQPLNQFLKNDFQLNDEAISSLVHCIALSHEGVEVVSVEAGLAAIKSFVGSIGRFGSHALLWALYGAGSEISQAFCRMCALHNGIYILNCPPKEMVLPGSDVKPHITTPLGQVLTSTSLILSIDHLPTELQDKVQIDCYVARMVVALHRLDIPDEVRLIVFPQKAFDTPAPIFGLVLSNEAACPRDQTLIQLWTVLPEVPQHDYLSPALHLIVGSNASILFKMGYLQAVRRFRPTSPVANLIVCDDPSPDPTFESLISRVQSHFHSLIEVGEIFPPKEVAYELES